MDRAAERNASTADGFGVGLVSQQIILNPSRQTQPEPKGIVFNLYQIVAARHSLFIFNATHTMPRDKKGRMKYAKQKHRIKIHAAICEYDSNNMVVMSEISELRGR